MISESLGCLEKGGPFLLRNSVEVKIVEVDQSQEFTGGGRFRFNLNKKDRPLLTCLRKSCCTSSLFQHYAGNCIGRTLNLNEIDTGTGRDSVEGK